MLEGSFSTKSPTPPASGPSRFAPQSCTAIVRLSGQSLSLHRSRGNKRKSAKLTLCSNKGTYCHCLICPKPAAVRNFGYRVAITTRSPRRPAGSIRLAIRRSISPTRQYTKLCNALPQGDPPGFQGSSRGVRENGQAKKADVGPIPAPAVGGLRSYSSGQPAVTAYRIGAAARGAPSCGVELGPTVPR
jgi:hypothetical protein